MDAKKLFISLPFENNLVNRWHKGFTKLNLPQAKIKAVPPANFHLTLKFLGWLPLDKLLPIIETIRPLTANREEFTLVAAQPEIFPADKTKAPRVLSICFIYNQHLQQLFDEVEEALWQAGLAHKEPRRFTPHLTLARVKTSAKYDEFQDFIDWKVSGESTANCLQLMESVAGKFGPEYFVLEHFNF